MTLYHVSCKKYEVGDVLKSPVSGQTEYYKSAITKGLNWIDDYLDTIRPDGYPERKSALYAFDCIANCFAFKKNKCSDTVNYYIVKMLNPVSCPMCLTDKLIKDSNSHNLKIGQEYWNPTMDWKFLEYLSNEMEILEILNNPTFNDKIIGQNNYQNDYDLKETL